MKKRIWVVGGSFGAGVILVLAMLAPVIGAQTVKINEKRINVFQQIKQKIENILWQPGDLLAVILLAILVFLNYLRSGGAG